jgi:CheY-like chemotaxis protein
MNDKSVTFLLVEDDPNDVLFVKRAFREAPATIRLHAVNDGAQAMEYLQGHGEYADRAKYPIPDVILLDLKMPRVNGFEFLEWLRASHLNHLHLIPVVIMSSSAERQDIQRAYSLGVNSYLVKPINWQEFRERIKALGIYWSEHVETPESHSR